MKYVSAYLMAVLGGCEQPSDAEVKAILDAGGLDCDMTVLKQLLANVAGKQAHELIAAGLPNLQSLGGGGGAAVAASAGPAADAGAGAKAEEKPVEEEEEEEEEG